MSFLPKVKLVSAQLSSADQSSTGMSPTSSSLCLLSLPAHSPEQGEATGAGLPSLWPFTALRTAWVQLCLPGWVLQGGGSYHFTSFGAQNNFLALLTFKELPLIIHVPPLQFLLAAERRGRANRKEQGGSGWSAEALGGCSLTASHPTTQSWHGSWQVEPPELPAQAQDTHVLLAHVILEPLHLWRGPQLLVKLCFCL